MAKIKTKTKRVRQRSSALRRDANTKFQLAMAIAKDAHEYIKAGKCNAALEFLILAARTQQQGLDSRRTAIPHGTAAARSRNTAWRRIQNAEIDFRKRCVIK